MKLSLTLQSIEYRNVLLNDTKQHHIYSETTTRDDFFLQMSLCRSSVLNSIFSVTMWWRKAKFSRHVSPSQTKKTRQAENIMELKTRQKHNESIPVLHNLGSSFLLAVAFRETFYIPPPPIKVKYGDTGKAETKCVL